MIPARRAASGVLLACIATAALAACGRTTEPPPSLPAAPLTPPPPVTVPDGQTRFGAPDAPTATHAERPDPLRPMTPAEESSSMPKAGQANDHSNPAAQPVPLPRTEPAR
jgi:hypothetical protein